MVVHNLNDTAHKILDVAENYTQTRGFNDFSYRDIQQDLGIKTSSIHYYFATKQDLAVAMVARYIENYKIALKEVDASDANSIEKLEKLGDMFLMTAKKNKFCLCGMLMADIVAMPQAVVAYLTEFFDMSKIWISGVIRDGIKAGEIKETTNSEDAAAHYLASLEGGLLIARTRKQDDVLSAVINQSLNAFRI